VPGCPSLRHSSAVESDSSLAKWWADKGRESRSLKDSSYVEKDSALAKWWADEGENELRLILWAAWDPIGMVLRDEYDGYVPLIWEMLVGRVSREEIAARLGAIRVEWMGLPANPDHDAVVAWKLQDWMDPPGIGGFRPVDLLR
jgi:hypothetical protein